MLGSRTTKKGIKEETEKQNKTKTHRHVYVLPLPNNSYELADSEADRVNSPRLFLLGLFFHHRCILLIYNAIACYLKEKKILQVLWQAKHEPLNVYVNPHIFDMKGSFQIQNQNIY